jgi:cell pole-organizing protein PopZ
MEEILASIRKIISEDAPEGGAPAPAAPAPEAAPAPVQAAPAPEPEVDVLELTQEFIEEPMPAPVAVAAPAPVVEPPKENDVIFQADAPVAAPAMSAPHDGIFSDTTRKAMDDTFANIPDEEPAPAPRAAHSFAPVDGASVEAVFEKAIRDSFEPVMVKYLTDNSAMVIEGMKPLIREWMDEHFPALLEGAVRAEVERVVKARAVKR